MDTDVSILILTYEVNLMYLYTFALVAIGASRVCSDKAYPGSLIFYYRDERFIAK